MLNAFRKFAMTARAGALVCAAAMLLSACGGVGDPGSDPALMDQNLSAAVSVDASAAPAGQPQEEVFDWRTANGSEPESPDAVQADPAMAQAPQSAPVAPPTPVVASAGAGAAAYVPADV